MPCCGTDVLYYIVFIFLFALFIFAIFLYDMFNIFNKTSPMSCNWLTLES